MTVRLRFGSAPIDGPRFTDTLHDRIAESLGWEVEDVRSFSLQTLRELVPPQARARNHGGDSVTELRPMSSGAVPSEYDAAGRAAYEAHAVSLGETDAIPWDGLPHRERVAWCEAGRAARALPPYDAAGVPVPDAWTCRVRCAP